MYACVQLASPTLYPCELMYMHFILWAIIQHYIIYFPAQNVRLEAMGNVSVTL